jgi:Spy/CpxP family protein refolding chaperone
MKSKLSSVLFSTLLAASALLAVQVRAEDAPGTPPPGGPPSGGEHKKAGEKGKMPSPSDRVEKMKENLGLSDEQATQIKEILTSETKDLEALKKDESVPMEQKKEKAAAIREGNKAKIDALLTPEQKAKADAARAKMGPPGAKGKKEKGKKGDKAAPAAE